MRFLLSVFFVWWLVGKPEQVTVPEQTAEKGAAAAIVFPASSYDEALPTSEDNCLTPQQLKTHPSVLAEVANVELLFARGPLMEPYRGLGRADLLSLADQNDSAAMAVLGAMAFLRAYAVDEQKAVDYLLMDDHTVSQELSRATAVSNADEELETAIKWYYESALHGRLFVLTRIGQLLDRKAHDLVEKDSVGQQQGSSFTLTAIYTGAAMEVAGNPTQGILASLASFPVRSELIDAAAADVAAKFQDDLEALNLPPIEIPESTLPSLEEMGEMLCEEYRPD